MGPGSLADYADTSDGGATWDYRDSVYPYFIQVKAIVSLLAGDYNNDGIVDAADYTVWRDSLGATGTGLAADGDGNGAVDQGDYDIWRNNFGATFGGGSGSSSGSLASVPEPATLTMSVLLVFCVSLRRQERVGGVARLLAVAEKTKFLALFNLRGQISSRDAASDRGISFGVGG